MQDKVYPIVIPPYGPSREWAPMHPSMLPAVGDLLVLENFPEEGQKVPVRVSQREWDTRFRPAHRNETMTLVGQRDVTVTLRTELLSYAPRARPMENDR